MNIIPIQVTQQEVIIPLSYFPRASELELVITDDVAVVRVKKVVPGLHRHARREEMLRETAVFEAQLDQLKQHYLGQYVAFHGGKLIDHDTDHKELVQRMSAQYPHAIVLIRQVTDEPPAPLSLGSPRLVR